MAPEASFVKPVLRGPTKMIDVRGKMSNLNVSSLWISLLTLMISKVDKEVHIPPLPTTATPVAHALNLLGHC